MGQFIEPPYLQHSATVLTFPRQGDRQKALQGILQIPQYVDEDFAFQYPMSKDAWVGTIPRGTDVLITQTRPDTI